MENKKILDVRNVNKFFKSRGVLKHALNDISFQMNEGDFLGVIGESGSGKTTLGRAIIRLLEVSGGDIDFLNKNISTKVISKKQKQWLADNMQMIFQDPLSSLNPNMNIIKLVSEPLEISKEIIKKVKEVIDYKVIFNSFYKYDFLLKTKKVINENSIGFFVKYNEILQAEIEKSKNFKFSDKESWVTSYNEVEKLYEDILFQQKKLVPYLEKIIGHNSTVLEKMLVRLEKRELDEDFLEFYDDLKLSESKSNNLLKTIKNRVKEEFGLYREKIGDAKKEYLLNNLREATFSYKFNKNNSDLAKTKIEYLRFKLISEEAKIKKEIFKEALKFKFVSEDDLKEIIIKATNSLDKLYRKADLLISQIDSKATYNKSLLAIENKFNYDLIKNKVFNLFQKELHDLNEEVPYNKFKRSYLNYMETHHKTYKVKITQLKKRNKILKQKVYKIIDERLKMLLNLRPKSLNSFTSKERFIVLRNNKKTFKSELKLKKSAMSSMDWEYENTMANSKLYEDLFSKSRTVLQLHKADLVKLLTLEEVYKALEAVGLKKEHAYRYPHEFSGGQRQRIVIARALINDPKMIIADEAISALDVSVQAQVINIMKKFSVDRGMSFLFIAHDLSMVRNICNKVIIMHNGRIVEKGLVEKIFENPVHPYTKALFKAIPEIDKMHVDLAMFNINHDYDEHYSPSNIPTFHKITENHEVLATDYQIKKWAN